MTTEDEALQELLSLSKEDPKQYEAMVQYLNALKQIAEEDPQAYAALAQAAQEQRSAGAGAAGSNGGASPATPRPPMELLDALKKSLNDSQNGANAGVIGGIAGNGNFTDKVNLPGGSTLGPKGVEKQQKGIEMRPDKGFVVKTRRTDTADQCKVFINMCSSPLISKPKLTKKLDENGQEVDAVNYPISIGPTRSVEDKQGQQCLVFDAVFNPAVLEEANKDKTGAHRDSLVELAIRYAEQKHKMSLDPKHKLPKLAYKGEELGEGGGTAKQWVRDIKSEPQIEEISKEKHPEVMKTNLKAGLERKPLGPLVQATLSIRGRWIGRHDDVDLTARKVPDRMVTEHVNAWPDMLELIIGGLGSHVCNHNINTSEKKDADNEDSGGTTMTSALLPPSAIRLSEFEITATLPGHHSLSTFLPYSVHPTTAEAMLDPHEATVTISVTVDKTPLDAGRPDPGSRPWMLARALSGRDGDKNTTRDGGKKKSRRRKGEGAGGAKGDGNGDYDDDDDDGGDEEEEEISEYPEDKFHLKLPEGYNKYTGQWEGVDDPSGKSTAPGETPISEMDMLPEDKFHQKDVVSQHMMQIKEQQKKDKHDSWAKERAERDKNPDPNVEYIDVDAYKPGGKYGPKVTRKVEEPLPVDTQAAASLSRAQVVLSQAIQQQSDATALSSKLYAELL